MLASVKCHSFFFYFSGCCTGSNLPQFTFYTYIGKLIIDLILQFLKNCQRLGWKFHKNECRRLKKVFPHLPLTEVLFLSRIIDRVVFLEQNGDKFNWERDRKWSELLGHQEDIKNDEVTFATNIASCLAY